MAAHVEGELNMAFNLDDYEPVEARLEKFWRDWPDGRVYTLLEHHGAGEFIVYAACYRRADDPHPAATGLAHEVVGQGMVNKTAALENCETSAIGRALANMGYATKGARASREEMEKVQRDARGATPPDPKLAAHAKQAARQQDFPVPGEDDLWRELYAMLESARPNEMTVAELDAAAKRLYELTHQLGVAASFKANEDATATAVGAEGGWKGFKKDEKVLCLSMFVNEIKDAVKGMK